MKVLVIGYGVSGKAATAFLRFLGHEVVVVDQKGGEGILFDKEISLDDVAQVILSPGIAQTHPLVQEARALGIEIIGEIELGFRYLSARNRCFGITGSNGKTTTVLLTTHILNEAGKKAHALGNVGDSLTEYLIKKEPDEILVIELSSFQLETLHTKALEAAIVLNITPNHLDRYHSLQEYAEAKAWIQNIATTTYVSRQVRDEFEELFKEAQNFEKEIELLNCLSYTQLAMPSKQSIQASYLLCKRCGVTDTEFLQGLATFKKPPHRIEWVTEIDGVTYYNDSKSSNVDSVIHAVERFTGPLILIVGGVHKGSSYQPWIEKFKRKVRSMIAYGKAAPIIEYELAAHFPLKRLDRFPDAVKYAKAAARKQETVLLSPGCSSYDQFESYVQRGDSFKRLVREK